MTAAGTAASGGAAPAVELRGIDKRFGAVHANRGVSLRIEAGCIHGIVGENGAGKSTLMSILTGFYQADAGEVRVHGRVLALRSTADAIAAGIGMVHQHFMLVDDFTVLENVMLGAEGGALLASGRRRARAELMRLGSGYGLAVDPDAIAGELTVGARQRVEILRALYRGARILVLDEPTGVLTPQEADQLFRVLAALRGEGVTVILITHKLREILAVTDSVSVMRDGAVVATLPTAATDAGSLAELMVGRKVLLRVDRPPATPGEVVLEVDGLRVDGAAGGSPVLRGVDFGLRAGEVVGIAGVAGNGQSELLEVLAGMRAPDGGGFTVLGRRVDAARPCGPRTLRALGVAHVPEDRLRTGLVATFSAAESALLGHHDDACYNGALLTRPGQVRRHAARLMQDMDVRPPDPDLRTAGFSGGNQQKLLLGRELEHSPRVLLVGQPTRGVDIGAIELIHARLLAMRAAGAAILLVSVELDEILALSDRILVMFEGRVVGSVEAAEADERDIGLMMANAHAGAAGGAARDAHRAGTEGRP